MEQVIGRLVWITELWVFLRPLLADMYSMMYASQSTRISLDWGQWKNLLRHLDADLCVQTSIGHHSIRPGWKLKGAGSVTFDSIAAASQFAPRKSRLRACFSDPEARQLRVPRAAAIGASYWAHLLKSGTLCFSMLAAQPLNVQCFADARADKESAGLGGYFQFSESSPIWFQFTISRVELQRLIRSEISSMQSLISALEMRYFGCCISICQCVALHVQ